MKNKIIVLVAINFVNLLSPNIVHAQSFGYVESLINSVNDILGVLAPLLIGVAVVVFFWGVVRYIKGAANPDERIAGRGLMIYGVISLFVIVSIWGLVSILQTLTGTEGLGLGDVGVPVLPSPDSM